MTLILCRVVGFEIDKESICMASGENILCRECGIEKSKSQIRKRCSCGKGFFPKSNRQRSCDRCSKLAEKRRKSEWARKNREASL